MTSPEPARAAIERALALACEQEELARSTRIALQAALGMPDGSGMIALKVAADDWGVSDDTVRRWAIEGRVRSEKLIGRWYVQAERPSGEAQVRVHRDHHRKAS